MAAWNTVVRGAAFAAVASLALAACSDSSDDASEGGSTGTDSPLKIGSLLPVTGSLAFLGPPEIAGVDLAVKEINDAGGVLGAPVEITHTDSSDANSPQIAAQSVSDLISDDVAAIIGAASSSVTLNVIDDVDAAGVVMVSPANTSTTLSGYSEFYFRTAPPDTAQGAAVSALMMDDGAMSIGILVQNDDYGTSFRDVVESEVTGAGGTITYGTAGQEVDPAASNFSSDVSAVLDTNPDAILMIAFDQTTQIIPELIAGGYDPTKIYMTDGNTADWSATFEPGTLEGGKGTIPGAQAPEDFRARLQEVAPETLTDFSYAAESYDAVMLVALAALLGGGTDAATVQANMAAVSGAEGGTECTGFQECADLIEAGEAIDYSAISAAGPFDENNDPTTALIGVFQYDADNKPVWVDEVFWEAAAS